MKTKKEWCTFKQPDDMGLQSKKGKSRRVRCPSCKKRFMTVWYDCHYDIPFAEECWHESLPDHKRIVK